MGLHVTIYGGNSNDTVIFDAYISAQIDLITGRGEGTEVRKRLLFFMVVVSELNVMYMLEVYFLGLWNSSKNKMSFA